VSLWVHYESRHSWNRSFTGKRSVHHRFRILPEVQTIPAEKLGQGHISFYRSLHPRLWNMGCSYPSFTANRSMDYTRWLGWRLFLCHNNPDYLHDFRSIYRRLDRLEQRKDQPFFPRQVWQLTVFFRFWSQKL